MQKQYNELEVLITEAYQRKDPTYLNHILNIIYNKVDLRTCSLKKVDIEKLNRLSYKADSISNYYTIGLIYDHILSLKLIDVTSMDYNILMAMANSLIPVLENTKGTSLSLRVVRYIRALFFLLLQRNEISEEDRNRIESLLNEENLRANGIYSTFDENTDAKEIMALSKSKSMQDKITAVIRLMDLFTYCQSFQEQMDVFGQKTLPILKFLVSGTNESSMELFEILGTFLEIMVFQSECLVNFDKAAFDLNLGIDTNPELFIHLTKDKPNKQFNANEVINIINKEIASETKPKQVVAYSLLEHENIIRKSEGVYSVVTFLLNIFVLYPKALELQLMSIRILERMYFFFPVHRKNMEEPLLVFFSHLNSETSEEIKKPAAVFLYKLIHRDASPAFATELKNREGLQSLFSSPYYSSSVLTIENNEIETFDINDLHIRAGSPLNLAIEAGASRSELIEVWQPYSLLTFGFATLQYDITFSLDQVCQFKSVAKREKDNFVSIIKNEKVDSTKYPVRGSVLIKEPGIYRLEFDNKSSWFNTKTVRFRLLVLSPNLEDSHELKAKQKMIHEATLGQMPLPSAMFGVETQMTMNSARSTTSTNTSMIGAVPKVDEIRSLVYLTPRSVEFSMISSDKEYEIVINYDPEAPIDWEKINSRVMDILNIMVDVHGGQDDGRVLLQVVYDEKIMENLVSHDRYSEQFLKHVYDYFADRLVLTGKLRKLLKNGKHQLHSEIEFQVQKILLGNSDAKYENFVLLVLDYSENKIFGKLRKQTHIIDINLEAFAVPIMEETKEGDQTAILRSAEVLVFDTGISDAKRIGYLAYLIHTVFCFSARSMSNYVVIEDVPVLFGEKKPNNRSNLNKVLNSFNTSNPELEGLVDNPNPLNIHIMNENKDSNIKL